MVMVAGLGGVQLRNSVASAEVSTAPRAGSPPVWSTIIAHNDQGIMLYPERLIETADGGYAVLAFSMGHPDGTIWLGRFDAQGTLLWEEVYKIDYLFGGGAPKDVCQCADGGFAIIGTTPNIHGDMTHFLIRTEPDGMLRWKKMFPLLSGNIDQGGCSVMECGDGGFVMTGWRVADYFLHRIDAEGNYLWHQFYSSAGSTFVDFVHCEDAGFALAGTYNGDYIALTRTNSTGGFLWEQNFTFPGAPLGLTFSGLKQTTDNGFILYGETFGQGSNSAAFDIYLLRTDTNGVMLWNHTFGGPLHDTIFDVVQCSDGGYMLVGGTWRIGEDFRDILLVRTNVTGNQEWNCTYPDYLPKGTFGIGIIESSPGVFVVCADIVTVCCSSVWLFSIPDIPPPDPNLPFLGIPPELVPAILFVIAVVAVIVIFALVWILRQRRLAI